MISFVVTQKIHFARTSYHQQEREADAGNWFES